MSNTTTIRTLRSLITDCLVRRSADLSDAEREWALERGYASLASVEVELTDAEPWRSDWRSDGGSWPYYTLAVSVDGAAVGEVVGWHYVGMIGPDGNHSCQEWTCEDNDGAYSGTPSYDGDGAPTVEHPVTSGGSLALPTQDAAGRVLLYDADDVQAAIDAAAEEADHGDAPSLDDLTPSRKDDLERTLYVVRDYRVVEVEVRRAEAYPDGETYDERDWKTTTYLVTGYYVQDGDGEGDVCETADEAVRREDPIGDDDERYDTEAAAEEALAGMVDDRLDELDDMDGMEHGRETLQEARTFGVAAAGALYVAPEGAEADDETDAPPNRCHLDADDVAAVCLRGWDAVRAAVALETGDQAIASWLAWSDGAVRKLAAAVQAGDAPPALLADALEDAGCTDAQVLGDLRRGMKWRWVAMLAGTEAAR